ncbi:hypothetical protein M409DRAFT_54123 [Zasmidium cellare ATCC 36951]|uniref:Oxidoreductase n=1 Tax=Zasmidium cellare ATCC 36951 TaxID=1080233 RepID=A0A6A6CK45_ZASCE|nr:uncharacterized protein M409DRAFT_54123 [Zasmidium cellare ATCC 36951]KAF2167525.1 hypothetical protein M409DRAFT_54123 [Zasmidium cellare ATCC 36951]
MSTVGRLANKVALVTGAGSGFGRAIATRFANEGCKVLVSDVNEDGARETAEKIGKSDSTHVMKFDVTSEGEWKRAVGEVENKWGRLDILINNAGWAYKNKPTLDVTTPDFDRVFTINVKSIFHSIPAVIPSLRRAGGGSIINISSIGSERPRPGLVWYNASKAAVTNATRGLAAEYGPDGIRVNALAPLLSGTGLFEQFVGVPHTPENVKTFVEAVPLAGLTDPEDVANYALYLSSDEGAFVTGQNLVIDGGKGI